MLVHQLATGTRITIQDSERQPCEVWSRVMGYHRPVQDWNVGKKSEHQERKHFLETRLAKSLFD